MKTLLLLMLLLFSCRSLPQERTFAGDLQRMQRKNQIYVGGQMAKQVAIIGIELHFSTVPFYYWIWIDEQLPKLPGGVRDYAKTTVKDFRKIFK